MLPRRRLCRRSVRQAGRTSVPCALTVNSPAPAFAAKGPPAWWVRIAEWLCPRWARSHSSQTCLRLCPLRSCRAGRGRPGWSTGQSQGGGLAAACGPHAALASPGPGPSRWRLRGGRTSGLCRSRGKERSSSLSLNAAEVSPVAPAAHALTAGKQLRLLHPVALEACSGATVPPRSISSAEKRRSSGTGSLCWSCSFPTCHEEQQGTLWGAWGHPRVCSAGVKRELQGRVSVCSLVHAAGAGGGLALTPWGRCRPGAAPRTGLEGLEGRHAEAGPRSRPRAPQGVLSAFVTGGAVPGRGRLSHVPAVPSPLRAPKSCSSPAAFAPTRCTDFRFV